MQRRSVEIKPLSVEGAHNLPEKLVDFIAYFQDVYENIPKDFRDEAVIEIDSYQYWETTSERIDVFYNRLETDEEYLERKRKTELDELRLRKSKLQQFIKLKEELFGDTDEEFVDRL